MIQQLVQRIMTVDGVSKEIAAAKVLGADPFDLLLYMEQCWDVCNVWYPNASPVGQARRTLYATGAFAGYAPAATTPPSPPTWDHLGYAYVLENTRVVQIFRRVVREYRSGEGLGMPSVETQRWLDATETLLFGAANPVSAWLSTSTVRQDAEAVRRNAYWRLFGLDLAFGTEDNRPPTYDKANAANTTFVPLFEELLYELWQAISNLRNTSGANQADDDRIYRLSEELQYVLRSRRQLQVQVREELAAATALGWAELTLSANTPVVIDLKSQATSSTDRLRMIGERVGLAAHSKSAASFSMSSDLSILLRTIEAGYVTGPSLSWILYRETPPSPLTSPIPIGASSRRVITEWAAATGKDLKVRAKPIETRRQLASVR